MYKYSGIIRDLESGLPLAGVTVKLQNNLIDLAKDVSGANGVWEIEGIDAGSQLSFFLKGYTPIHVASSEGQDIRLIPSKIFAYSDKDTYSPNENVRLFVHSKEKFYFKLVRYGMSIDTLLKSDEINPIIQEHRGPFSIDKGLSWKSHIDILLPVELVSGLYGIQLIDKQNSETVVPIVIRIRSSSNQNKIMIVANTLTWHANNTFGGKSRYHDLEKIRTSSQGILIQFKKRINTLLYLLGLKKKKVSEESNETFYISRNRPLRGIGLENVKSVYDGYQSHLAGGEWRLLAWMEEMGYTYDYYSDTSIAEAPDLIGKYDTVILNTHSKYWGVEAFKKLFFLHNHKGLNVVNWGGNAIFSFVHSISNMGFVIEESNEKRDSSGEDIFGVSFNQNSYSSCAPYIKEKRNHELFDGINDESFGEQSQLMNELWIDSGPQPGRIDLGNIAHKYKLNGIGASGWEVDQIVSHRNKEIELVAVGKNKKGGAHMTFRKKSEVSGFMFSASSVAFTASLLVDSNISKLAKNVIIQCHKFGSVKN